MKNSAIDVVNKLLRQLCSLEDITPSMSIVEDIGMDSLSVVLFIVDLENELNVLISDSDLDPASLITVSDLYALATKYTST